MLTAKNCKASTAVQYFTDDYDPGQTRWFGKGASALGLHGEIDRESFEHICYGRSPDGSKYLGTKGDPDKRRAGTDFTFSAPKSVSLTALVGGDTCLENAHRLTIEKTLKLIEKRYAQTRITKNGKVAEIQTGNLVVAQSIDSETTERFINDAIAYCSERSVDFRVEDIEKFVIAQRLPLDIADIKSLCNARSDLIKLDRNYTTFKAQIQAEVSDSAEPRLRERIQVEPLLDNVNEGEDELDKQEGVKVPTYGGGVKVPTHGGDVCVPTSRNFDNSYQAISVTNL